MHYRAFQENMYLLKRMFKQLDPAVMKTTNDVQGELKVSVKFVSDQSVLLVKVRTQFFYCDINIFNI